MKKIMTVIAVMFIFATYNTASAMMHLEGPWTKDVVVAGFSNNEAYDVRYVEDRFSRPFLVVKIGKGSILTDADSAEERLRESANYIVGTIEKQKGSDGQVVVTSMPSSIRDPYQVGEYMLLPLSGVTINGVDATDDIKGMFAIFE